MHQPLRKEASLPNPAISFPATAEIVQILNNHVQWAASTELNFDRGHVNSRNYQASKKNKWKVHGRPPNWWQWSFSTSSVASKKHYWSLLRNSWNWAWFGSRDSFGQVLHIHWCYVLRGRGSCQSNGWKEICWKAYSKPLRHLEILNQIPKRLRVNWDQERWYRLWTAQKEFG